MCGQSSGLSVCGQQHAVSALLLVYLSGGLAPAPCALVCKVRILSLALWGWCERGKTQPGRQGIEASCPAPPRLAAHPRQVRAHLHAHACMHTPACTHAHRGFQPLAVAHAIGQSVCPSLAFSLLGPSFRAQLELPPSSSAHLPQQPRPVGSAL